MQVAMAKAVGRCSCRAPLALARVLVRLVVRFVSAVMPCRFVAVRWRCTAVRAWLARVEASWLPRRTVLHLGRVAV